MSANTCLYISNAVVVAFSWETVLKIVGLMGQPSSLSTAYKFAALGPNFPLYIQGVFKFLPILIADVLMVGGSINIEIISRPFLFLQKDMALLQNLGRFSPYHINTSDTRHRRDW